jgi:hypothetical protein
VKVASGFIKRTKFKLFSSNPKISWFLWIVFRKKHDIFGFALLVTYPFAFLIYSVGKHPKYFLKLVAK